MTGVNGGHDNYQYLRELGRYEGDSYTKLTVFHQPSERLIRFLCLKVEFPDTVFPDISHGLIYRISNEVILAVILRNGTLCLHQFNMFKQFFMKCFVKNHYGKLADLIGLNKGKCFKVFIQCAKAAGHYHKSIGVFYEECFTDKEITDAYPLI